MNRKFLLRSCIILLIVASAFADRYNDDDDDGYSNRKSYKKNRGSGIEGSDDDEYSSRNGRPQYNDGGVDGYFDDDDKIIGEDGNDSREYGQSIADYGPIYGKKEDMYGSMTFFIKSINDWEQKGQKRYGKQRSNRRKNDNYDNKDDDYNKNDKKDDYNDDKKDDYKDDKKDDYNDDKKDDYKDDDYKDKNNKGGYRRKRSYSKVQFPVVKVKNYRKFPFRRLPPLISIAPWLPIFYDKLTYQTFIFSPVGGIIIVPPLINFYGQRFAVAQLIKWGYASLVQTGAPPPPAVDVAPLIQPAPAAGPIPAGVIGSKKPAPAPAYDTYKHKFKGGVKTDFPSFKPRYGQTVEEGGNNKYGSSSGPSYGPEPNYGGSRTQEVRPQGN